MRSSRSWRESIKANGIIQPILVRRTGDTYRIIAGERRWRAAQRAGLHKVPVVVRDVADGDKQLLELALDREHPARESESGRRSAGVSAAGRRVLADPGADRRGRRQGPQLGRELMRLLKLPEEVRADLASGALSMGHARALLALADAAAQRHGAREVISRGLSVRDTEALVKKLAPPKTAARERRDTQNRRRTCTPAPPRIGMRFALGTKVRIVRRGDGGRIEIEFGSEDELNRIYELSLTRG